MYKSGIKKGCTDQGVSRGDGVAATDVFCQCVLDVLESNLSREKWQEATFAVQNKQDAQERRILGPYLKEMQGCRKSQ